MERIDLFDKYINDQLSEKERADFDARLESDENFASEFRIYLFTVDGICREAHQDDLDFGVAMKNLSEDQLKEIIGKRDEAVPAASCFVRTSDNRDKAYAAASCFVGASDNQEERVLEEAFYAEVPSQDDEPRIEKPKKVFRFRPWMWQVASIAAVVIIAFTVVLNIEKTARISVDNAIYACAEISPDLARSADEPIDVKSLSDDELKAKFPALIALYDSASDPDEIADSGYALAMAYLRFHDRKQAKEVLEQLVVRFDGNPDYAEDVDKWKSILTLLK